jgi:hypothetical protein
VETLEGASKWRPAKVYSINELQCMAKRKKRLPHGQLGKPIVLENTVWRAVADAAKIKLTHPVLARLHLSTIWLGGFGQIERSAPAKVALTKIKRLEELINDLRRDFPSGSDQESELFFSNLPEIQRYFTRSKEQFQQVGLMFLLEMLSHVLMLNQKLLRAILKIGVNPNPVYAEGEAWDIWIVLLTNILKNAGLPTEVRNDQEKPSRFAVFVREIQDHLPSHLYKKRSDDALAKAITRARKRIGETGAPDFLLFSLLGAFKWFASGQSYNFEVEPNILRGISEILDFADKPNIGRSNCPG